MKKSESAVVLVYNSKSELALQLRGHLDKKYPLHWDFSAAGGIEKDEPPEKAAARELFEEIGINSPLSYVGEYLYQDEKGNDYLYVYKTVYDGEFKPDGIEVDEVKYFSKENIQKMLDTGAKFHPELPFLWEKGIL